MKNIYIYRSRKINTEYLDKTNGNVYVLELWNILSRPLHYHTGNPFTQFAAFKTNSWQKLPAYCICPNITFKLIFSTNCQTLITLHLYSYLFADVFKLKFWHLSTRSYLRSAAFSILSNEMEVIEGLEPTIAFPQHRISGNVFSNGKKSKKARKSRNIDDS